MKIGDISIHYLNGGNTKMDGGAMFGVVPKPLWSKQYNANERNQINLPTHPILIQTAQYNLIIDAGIGNGKLSEKQLRNFGVDEESHIIADLANYNLTPKDIDYVLMTHMHFDHAAGLTDQAGHAIFENAIHVVQQDEWHEFIAPKPQIEVNSVHVKNGNTNNTKVNLNTASVSELMSVPGVGQAKANAIVEYRNQQGAFQEIDDLKKVKGFGSKTFDKLKSYFTT
ncbi:helix-hairpin-helix domain-containing protein [Staphylococcus aureus]|nr:helix-hairpin-helix domain-containing protein [Staphylococcus aureus]